MGFAIPPGPTLGINQTGPKLDGVVRSRTNGNQLSVHLPGTREDDRGNPGLGQREEDVEIGVPLRG